MTLLDEALKKGKKSVPQVINDEQIELAIAFAKGEVTHSAVCQALKSVKRLDKNMNHWLGKVIKNALRSGKIEIAHFKEVTYYPCDKGKSFLDYKKV